MRSLWRIGWLRGVVTVCILVLLSWTIGRGAVAAFEGAILFATLSTASIWGLCHARRLWARFPEAFRDSLLASLAAYLLFRGLLEFARTDGFAEVVFQPLIVPLFAPVASAIASVLMFPLLVWFSLTLVALASMATHQDAAAERSMLPLFWPTLIVSIGLDFILGYMKAWPIAGATLLSPLTVLGLVRALRRRDLDAQGFYGNLTQLLQRKCVLRRGRGLRDFRGIVLGLFAGCLTLCLATPMLRAFIAPYEGATYTAASQLGNRVQGMRAFLTADETREDNELKADYRAQNLGRALWLFSPDTKMMAPFRKVVVITYDDPARRLAQEKSEAQLQAQLLRTLTPAHPEAIALPLPPENGDGQPILSLTTPKVSVETLKGNTRDFPELEKAARAAGKVYISTSLEMSPGDAGRSVLKSATAVGSSEVLSGGSLEAPALNLTTRPPPLSVLLARPTQPRPSQELFLIDYRVNLQQIHAPISVSQVLQGQKLYDPSTRSWKTPAQFFAGKLILIEALTPRSHQTPAGPQGEMEIHAQATATLLQANPFGTLSFGIMAGLVIGLTMLVGHLCVGRAPLESLWRIVFPILFVGGGCFLVTAFGSVRADPVLPVLGGSLAFLMVTQFTFAMERDERSRNRSLLTRFVPPQAIEELLDDPDSKLGLGGKRRRIVVLFADVRGFSGFAERSTPEEVVATMNRYLMVMTDALNEHDGILDKYTGDGLMALFLVNEEEAATDVLRAVRAAEAMAMAVHNVAKTMEAEGGATLAVGLGLHYGEAVVGLVGHPTRQVNYTALGHTVVVAARLQTLAAGGDIILSEAVYRTLPPGSVSAEAGETVTVKGVADPVPIYRIQTTSRNL